MFLFFVQLSGNFLNIAFSKKGANFVFFNFLCFEMIFLKKKTDFAKTLKKGFQSIFVFFVVAIEEKTKMIAGISGFGFFESKMAVS